MNKDPDPGTFEPIDRELFGQLLLVHTSKKSAQIKGRVVLIVPTGVALWWIPFPELDPKTKRPRKHILEAQRINATKVKEGLEAGRISFVPSTFPASWQLSDDDFDNDVTPDKLARKSRAKSSKWVTRRNKLNVFIASIIKEFNTYDFLEGGLELELAAREAKKFNVRSRKIYQLLRLHMLGLGEKNALLPNFDRCGAVGVKKVFKKKPGPSNAAAAKATDPKEIIKLRGLVLGERDRENLAKGWKKYKKKGRSVKDAYILTMKEYYAESILYHGPYDVEVKLVEPWLRPTETEFRANGPNGFGDSARSINEGAEFFRGHGREIRHTSYDEAPAFGMRVFIDSTSEDQTPVSAASRIKILPSTWRTLVVESILEYIGGVYSGHEYASDWTASMAILHCSDPDKKDEMLDFYGVKRTPNVWLSFTPKYVVGDNGDLKTKDGIRTCSASEISSSFVRSRDPVSKKPVEISHFLMHRGADHHNDGTTHGRIRDSGEMYRELAASRNHKENFRDALRFILFRNNEQPAAHLLTMEMRNAGLDKHPTRQNMALWMRDMGYIGSEPIQLDLLRAKCLPKLDAVIHGDGVHIRDPRDRRKLIPQLVFTSDWLYNSTLLSKARREGATDCVVRLNPSDLSCCWLEFNGLRKLDLRARDPELSELTLVDWVSIADDDKLLRFLDRASLDDASASRVATNEATNAHARAEKKKELAVKPKPPSRKALRSGKTKARQDELAQRELEQLGLDKATDPRVPAQPAPTDLSARIASRRADLMKSAREGWKK